MGKKRKKARRQLKKALKALRKTASTVAPALLAGRAGALAGGGGLLVAAALDPKIQETARGLAEAVTDFFKRSAASRESDAEQSFYRH